MTSVSCMRNFSHMRNADDVQANILAKLDGQGRSIEWLSKETGIDVDVLRGELSGIDALTFFNAILIAVALNTTPPELAESEVTAQELAADVLKCSVQQVYRMAREGDIPGTRIGRSWRFSPSAVRAALAHKPVDLWAPRSRKKVRAA